ncbi:MAG: J domain-containing protein [Armatimonadetes bacterium]|nr:J domain-containing protein [Armatimonadota bacterium]
MNWFEVLGIAPGATDEEIRAAYLRKVEEYAPDRFPQEFERVRDAYQALRDPRARARLMLESADPGAPLVTLLDGLPASRRFLGPQAWLEALKRSRP